MTKRVRLARARKAAGYTQESFAEALGVDRSTVARWEAGDHEPLPYLRPKMARLLDVSREELNELLRLRPSVYVGDVVSRDGFPEPGDLALLRGGLLLPVVIDGHPTFLPLDASALLELRARGTSPAQDNDGRGWASADNTLHYAGRLDTAGEVSSDRTVRRIQALQQQMRPLQSVSLTELDEEITGFLRSIHDDEDVTT
jgi:transcriptional regulator with XRE-family HTH domain